MKTTMKIFLTLCLLFSLGAYAQNQTHPEVRDVDINFDAITKRMPKRKAIVLMKKISDYHHQIQKGEIKEGELQDKKARKIIQQAELLALRYIINFSIEKKLIHIFSGSLSQQKCECWSHVEKYLDIFKKAQIGNKPEWHFYKEIYKKITNGEKISKTEYYYLLERADVVDQVLEKLDQELEPIKEKEKIPTYKL